MTKAKYTPTPYRLHEPCKFGDYVISRKTEELAIASIVQNGFRSSEETKANAEFIVKACNTYEANQATIKALTEALRASVTEAVDYTLINNPGDPKRNIT